ncbi:MAG TPA: glycosyltransferase family 2 protein [Methylomirabilota bacterium]|nr:glycosyltransferase family 2 protein [Methylomirabilota bacterium]
MTPLVYNLSYGIVLLLGILAVIASLYSIILGRRYYRKVLEALGRRKVGFQPHVCVIMPCKGDEPNLESNIEALLKLNYPNYRVMIVADSEDDPAYRLANKIVRSRGGVRVKLLTSTRHSNASGKVSALLTALEMDKRNAEVYAFIDSDSTVNASWLSELVDPLADATVGATTGFRWYIATGFWSQVQWAWNASGSNLMFDDKYNFPWGGAMALRADTLDRIRIEEIWRDAVSDDLTLNIALRNCGYHTVFLPQCTVATFTNNITRSNLLKWATNQTTLTRTYHRKLWNYALAAYTFTNVTFIVGLIALTFAFLNTSWLIPATLLLVPTPLGLIRSSSRSAAFQRALPWLSEVDKGGSKAISASLIVPWIMTYCIFRSIFTREIEWRGRTYTLRKMPVATS